MCCTCELSSRYTLPSLPPLWNRQWGQVRLLVYEHRVTSLPGPKEPKFAAHIQPVPRSRMHAVLLKIMFQGVVLINRGELAFILTRTFRISHKLVSHTVKLWSITYKEFLMSNLIKISLSREKLLCNEAYRLQEGNRPQHTVECLQLLHGEVLFEVECNQLWRRKFSN